MRKYRKRLTVFVILFTMLMQTVQPGMPVSVRAADTSMFTDYLPEITEVTDEGGFTHPGVGLTKELLENVRAKVKANAEPWNTYFNAMLTSYAAGKNVTSSNQDGTDPSKPGSVAFNSQSFQSRFIADGLKAYTQALMYYITGDNIYRANALHIIRIWSQMDPAQYAPYTDCYIHSGVPLNRMVMAAEILRYSSCEDIVVKSAANTDENLNWTEQDTGNFTNNLINPTINVLQYGNNYFMNQHNYPLLGSIAGHIFTGNRERYNELIEWYTVNSTAKDQGFNGSLQQLFRLVDTIDVVGNKIGQGEKVEPRVQHVEMGRDQAHGGGDLTNAAIINRMLLAQETKVDPVKGTVSTDGNAVDPYEFLDNRILSAADFFWEYMLGYEQEWIPVAYSIASDGTIKDTYNRFSLEYKGRFLTANFWDLYSYYTYKKNEDVSQIAPYYYEAFTKKLAPTASGWENVDAGNDFWLYLPPEAEADAEKFIPRLNSSGSLIEVEDRATSLDSNTSTLTEDTSTFIRFNATEEGSKIALLSLGQGTKGYGLKLRTNGTAVIEMLGTTLTVSDTKGQWRYFTVSGSFGDFAPITVKGMPGVVVDLEHINGAADTQLTPPVFKAGTSDLNVFVYTGAPLNIDFSATDAGPVDLVTYEGFSMPQGSGLNKITGTFTWKPAQTGMNSFVIAASDGTAVAARKVNISVSADRSSAVSEILAPYNEDTKYESVSLENFKKVREETLSQIDTANDEDFCEQLIRLRSAVEGLKLITPVLSDGSMDYSKMVAASTLGTNLSWLIDGDNATFGGFKNGRDNLWHTFDFGADYKVSVSQFGLQSRMNFVDRAAGSVLFGSNDNVNWTRLTTKETAFTPEMSIIPVDDEFKNEKYRYLKIQLISPQPDIIHNSVQNILEWGELKIWGERYDANNKIASVSISSEQSSGGRIKIGDVVKLKIQAREEIQDMEVVIQGLPAMVTTEDNINWTAMAFMTKGVEAGDVKFTVDYHRMDGSSGDRVTFTTDGSKLFLVDNSDLIENVPDITNLIDPTPGSTAASTLAATKALFDKNSGTFSEYRTSNGSGGSQGWGAYIIFDFKTGNQVSLRNVEILARQDQVSRISGTVIQGSNDNVNFTTISTAAANTAEWQTLTINDNKSYRYIKVYNGGNWFGSMAELAFYGKVEHLIEDAIKQAEAVDRSIYTEESLVLLDAAVAEGRVLQSSTDATQAQVDAAVNKILTAIENLAFIEGMPVFDGLTDKIVKAGEQLTFTLKTINAGADVTYTVTGLPDGAAFKQATSTFKWIPDIEDGGNYKVKFTAEAGGLSSSKTINIKVIGNPVIESMGAVSLTARDSLAFQVLASDPAGMPLTYTCDKLPAGAILNPSTGVLSWIPGNEHYGSHTITFTVSNGVYSVSQVVTFHVDLYIYGSDGFTKGSYYLYDKEITEIKKEIEEPGADKVKLAERILQAEGLLEYLLKPGTAYLFDGNAKDITSACNGTTGGTVSYDGGKFGQAVSFNGSNSYVQLPASNPIAKAEKYTIAAWLYWRGGSNWQRIFDFGNSTTQYMFLSPSSGNNTLRFAIKNGGSEQLVETSKLAVNQWVHVAVTYENNTAKLYVNGELKATNAAVTIKPSDFKPSINYIAKSQYPDPLYNGLADEFYVYDYAMDETAIRQVMTGFSNILDKSLLAILLEEADNIVPEVYSEESRAAFTAALESGKEVMERISVTQAEVNAAAAALQEAMGELVLVPGMPVIIGLKDQLVKAETLVSFKVEAANAESITYSASGLPQGAAFHGDTQIFEWKPLKTQSGTYPVTFTVTAGEKSSSKTINIRVIGAPVFTSVPVIELSARKEFKYSISELVNDPAGLPLTYSADNLPSGAALDPSTGVFTWNPGLAYYGSNSIRFRVSNGEFEIAQTIEFKVDIDVVSPELYTRGSYFLYKEMADEILEQLKNPEADIVEQILKLGEAERSLIPLSTLPLGDRISVAREQVKASHQSWDKKLNANDNGWQAFDGSLTTITDAEANPAWILVDFGEGNEELVFGSKIYPRSGYPTRINGAIIQGSNDGVNFKDLYTISGAASEAWYTFPLNNITPYRYIRYYAATGNANVAEIEFYSLPLDRTLVELLLNRADTVKENQYPARYIEELKRTVENVKLSMDVPGISQEEIDNAAQILKAALDTLSNAEIVDATINPGATDFDKNIDNQADVTTTITWNDATEVTDVKLGEIILNKEVYTVSGSALTTVSGSALTIKKEFLAEQAVGSLVLTVEFDKGNAAAFVINITNTTEIPEPGIVDATISPGTASFDKNIDNQADVTAAITWNDATEVAGVKLGDTILNKQIYTVSGSALAIKKEFLAEQAVGSLVLTVEFDKGNAAAFVINITDTTEVPEPEIVDATINPGAASFDKNIDNQAEVTAAIIWNDATEVTGIRLGETILDKEAYAVNGNILIIKKEFLARQAVGSLALTVVFDKGSAAALIIAVKDTTSHDSGTQTETPTSTPTPAQPLKEEKKLDGVNGSAVFNITKPDKDGMVKVAIDLDIKVEAGVTKEVTLPLSSDKIVEQLKSKESKSVSITSVIPKNITDNNIEMRILLDEKLLKAAKDTKKDISISVEDADGKEQYAWTFTGGNLAASRQKVSGVNLALTVKALDTEEALKNISSANKNAKGLVVDFAHEGILPSEARVRIFVGNQEGVEPGNTIYLYHYNAVTGKLEALPHSTDYIVEKDGYITVNILHCSDYVILNKKANNVSVTSLQDQIIITPEKKTLYVGGTTGKTTTIKLELPVTLELVKNLKDTTSSNAVGAVTVTYKSGNTKVATVDSNGKITAKGVGTAKVTTTVTLYSGEKKTFVTAITVKKPYITITNSKASMKLGETYNFNAKAYGVGANDIQWVTTRKSVIVINKSNGIAKAQSKGADYIVAKVGKVEKKIQVVVK